MKSFDYSIVSNPEIFKQNVLPAHSDHTVYKSMEELKRGESSFRHSLNGIWKFHYSRSYRESIQGFESMDYNASSWTDIRVPAHIQLEGYDTPAYVNTQYPWDGREELEVGEIPEEFNPTASYVKYFELPDSMRGRRIFISFQGVESGFALWLNGKYVGYSEDSFTPSEFELTEYLGEGVQKLAVQVFKWTCSSWLEDQDFYRFSGIFRDVYLFTTPDIHVNDVTIRAGLDEDLSTGTLELSFDMSGKGGRLCYSLVREGNRLLSGAVDINSERLELSERLDKPELWSAEHPRLYELTVEVMDRDGALLEVFCERVGFRRFELRDGIMLLNGRRIVFHGVNRHEFSSDRGRVPDREEVISDIATMKRNNIDAVRTSHYPNASIIYGLCDEYGLYMIAENNMETHGVWDMIARGSRPLDYALPGNREEYLPMMLDRVNSTYQRDKNHPSVLIWSIGNESFGGSVTEEMANFFRKQDPYRLVHYEGTAHDRRYPDATDMESQMYTSVEGVEKFLRENPEKPFILCEYTHSMGNSNGAMHKYIELSDRERRYQGGFIWDFVDQSLRRKNRYGEEFQAYGGDCGERPTDYDFSGNGIVDGNRKPYDKMQEVKFNYQGLGIEIDGMTAVVKNRYLFTDAEELDALLYLDRDGKRIYERALVISLPPETERSFDLSGYLDGMLSLPGEYAITLSFRLKESTTWADKGYELAFGQGILNKEAVEKKHSGGIRVIHGEWNIGVKGECFDIMFSRNRGGIVSYRYGGKELILETPRPNFWRAPTSNDQGNQMPYRYGIWKIAGLYQSSMSPEAGENEELMRDAVSYPVLIETDAYVELLFKKWLPVGKNATVTVGYRVFGDGTVRVSMDYPAVPGLPPMPEFGFMMKLDADYKHLKWYGMGPAECYCDRSSGARLGIFEKDVRDNVQPYLVPQETGNRTGVRWAELTDDKGRGIRFSGVLEESKSSDKYASAPGTMEFSAIPYTPEQLEEARHPYELPRVHHTVVRASLKQMGVAGDDSWGAKTHDEYLIKTDEALHFAFEFCGI